MQIVSRRESLPVMTNMAIIPATWEMYDMLQAVIQVPKQTEEGTISKHDEMSFAPIMSATI